VCAGLLVGYCVFLAFVLLQTDAGLANWVVSGLSEWLHGTPAPYQVTSGARVEFVLNVAMFVPVAFLARLVVPGHPWANWVVYGFVASGLVEAVQGALLPLRSAQFVDVVANTGGVLVGSVAAGAFLALLARVRGRREDTLGL
jgi:glycopeptide antibiotics resistance protein